MLKTMRDKGLDRGLIRYFDDSHRNVRGQAKGFFGFRKMFRDYLQKLNVPFFDGCCPGVTPEGILPIRWNSEDELVEYYNPDEGWISTGLSAGTAELTELQIGDFTLNEDAISNGEMVASFIPVGSPENIAAGDGGAIDPNVYYTSINTDAGGDAFTLADGSVAGQRKRIRLVTDGGGSGVVTPANLGDGTTITFDDAGDDVELIWTGAAWKVIVNIGATVA